MAHQGQTLGQGSMAQGKGPNNQKFHPPVTVGLFPDTRQHHLCLLAPGSAAAFSQQLEKCLWSQQGCTEAHLVLYKWILHTCHYFQP